MKILAVDSSTWVETVAFLDEGSLISERIVFEKESHNRRLLATIESVLRDAGVSIREVDLFAVGIGPGSFTGLRIGITTMKSFAWSLGKPIVGISSLDALAAPFIMSDGYVCPMIDARKKEVYYAIYRADGSGKLSRETPYRVATPLKVADEISAMGIKRIFFCGDGWRAYKGGLLPLANCQVIDPPDIFNNIRASFIGMLAWQDVSMGVVSSSFELVPLYVRPSEAELKKAESK
ncbi:MAG: tRNA (adenosine(37)-N6)-threonylcarbamoyltransferase complex dimerization subunit type 1 TsaB [Syntrophobacterales bacterium]|nr:tRNA (adenosine(37)-N6)-threonylcarbamoyltransferase complex dimerization subunit type 1 TsaB [Syntrophobacterales bacterium]